MNIYLVDTFIEDNCKGNLAGVVVLQSWPVDSVLQSVATFVNASETAFVLKDSNGYNIRWFTPTQEVSLCGHATIATASVLKSLLKLATIDFNSKSGILSCRFDGDDTFFQMQKPQNHQMGPSKELLSQLKIFQLINAWSSSDYLYLMLTSEEFNRFEPDFELIKKIPFEGMVITAEDSNSQFDFVSRCFYPREGIDEDPVTGSAHLSLATQWQTILQKNEFRALQNSHSKGVLKIKMSDQSILIGGKCLIRNEVLSYKPD